MMVRNMIEKFEDLKDPLRFIGFFDRAYLHMNLESSVTIKANNRLCKYVWGESEIAKLFSDYRYHKQIIMITNVLTCFCEKMASRGGLYWNIPDTSLSEILFLFEDMLIQYIDSITAEKK